MPKIHHATQKRAALSGCEIVGSDNDQFALVHVATSRLSIARYATATEAADAAPTAEFEKVKRAFCGVISKPWIDSILNMISCHARAKSFAFISGMLPSPG